MDFKLEDGLNIEVHQGIVEKKGTMQMRRAFGGNE